MGLGAALILRFQQDDPLVRDLVAAEIDGTGATAILDQNSLEWRVFYPTVAAREGARCGLGPFCRTHGITLGEVDVADQDWARRSQAQLTAVRVGNIIVAPPWDVPPPGTLHEAPVVVVIEPSVGFGTGHHASTRLCLRALQRLDLANGTIIDVGTGSGVLAIAAAKLGAAGVTAIDTDADAVASARENAARNAVSIDFRVADVGGFTGRFDVVVANLTAAWLQRLAAPLLALSSNGTFVLAGLQTHERRLVLSAFDRAAATIEEAGPDDIEDGWTVLVLRKRN